MHNTLVAMLSDRGYRVARGSEYNEEKFLNPTTWILKGNHTIKRDFNAAVYVYYVRSAKHAEDVVKALSHCRVIIVFAAGCTPRFDRVRQCAAFANAEVFVEVFEERRLLFNVTKHFLVPKHVPLSDEQKAEVLSNLMVKETELQTISIDDPVAKYFGLMEAQVVMIIRHSENTGKFISYRICVDSGKSNK